MRRPGFGGLTVAVVFACGSLTPSLVPRQWGVQAGLTAVVTAIGYALGTFASFLLRGVLPWEPRPPVKRIAWWVLSLLSPTAVTGTLVLAVGWQRQMHRLMGMPPPASWGYLLAVLLGLTVAVLLVLAGRGVRLLAQRVARGLSKWIPPRPATLIGAVVVAVVLIGFLDGVVGRVLFASADQAFRLSDGTVDEQRTPPSSSLRSGSAASLMRWDDLGSKGRAFVSGGPSRTQLATFTQGASTTPIRVYAGLSSTDDLRARAELVVDELERTGAFERAVLCVVTTTGTGWVDPAAADALEYMWGGDTALAAMQYSYLPSWVSFLVNSSRARDAGAELFDAVYQRWAQLPVDQRPLLLVYGESLGADGSQSAFSGIADVRNRTDGALWVGPPNFSQLWSTLEARRDPGTPQRLPVYDGGATARFADNPEALSQPKGPWYRPRILFLQHASDPVVWWSPRLILHRPDWLAEPSGPDVLPRMRWYPLVTFWQITADLADARLVPDGHAHGYDRSIPAAWAAVAPSPGWSPADTQRLTELLSNRARRGDGPQR